MAEPVDFALRGDFVTLAALLKASGMAGSGGEAKTLATSGDVRVNGEPESRRGRKLRAGDAVRVADQQVHLQPASP